MPISMRWSPRVLTAFCFPKSRSGADVAHLDAKLTAREALYGVDDGATRILVLVTESAQALFGLENYRGSSKRLDGMTWGAEDLSADLGAETNRLSDGTYTDPYRLARAQCLIAAVAAEATPIDTIFANFRDSRWPEERVARRPPRRLHRQDGDPPRSGADHQRGFYTQRGFYCAGQAHR